MLKVKNLSIEFSRYSGSFKKKRLKALSSVDLTAKRGEVVGIVGSSGSGKSLLAHAILGILPANVSLTGKIIFKGEELTYKRKKELCGKEIALIPQSVCYLNPLCNTGAHVCRAGCLSGFDKLKAKDATDRSFKNFGLKDHVKRYLPFQISGGMARKVLTSAATIGQPDLLIADEPTTGLDAKAIQKSLKHLKEIANSGKTVLLITHDIESALKIADKIVVMYAGSTLEIAKSSDFNGSNRLRHPYTKGLWMALPQNEFTFIPGEQPSPDSVESGCPFEPRCSQHKTICKNSRPQLRNHMKGYVRCHHA
jgi:peptide/nickel transport system ATP-binding protein